MNRFSFRCDCGVSNPVLAGQAGLEQDCQRCGNRLNVPPLTSLSVDQVLEGGRSPRRSPAPRYSCRSILVLLTIVSVFLGLFRLQRNSIERLQLLDQQFSAIIGRCSICPIYPKRTFRQLEEAIEFFEKTRSASPDCYLVESMASRIRAVARQIREAERRRPRLDF